MGDCGDLLPDLGLADSHQLPPANAGCSIRRPCEQTKRVEEGGWRDIEDTSVLTNQMIARLPCPIEAPRHDPTA